MRGAGLWCSYSFGSIYIQECKVTSSKFYLQNSTKASKVSLDFHLEFLGAATAYLCTATAYSCEATYYSCAATAYAVQPRLTL